MICTRSNSKIPKHYVALGVGEPLFGSEDKGHLGQPPNAFSSLSVTDATTSAGATVAPKTISVLVPCLLSYRDIVGAIVKQMCLQLEAQGEEEAFTFQVTSAFNEAFNNVVIHGGKADYKRQVLVTVAVEQTEFVIELHDDGRSIVFKEERHQPEKLRESGMGLYIMRAFMNEIDYNSKADGGKNRLRMMRRLSC